MRKLRLLLPVAMFASMAWGQSFTAALPGRRLSGNHVDTNAKVFKTGAVPIDAFWRSVCADHLKFILAAPNSYFASETLKRQPTIARNFHLAQSFDDRKLRAFGRPLRIELWQRNAEPPAEPCVYTP